MILIPALIIFEFYKGQTGSSRGLCSWAKKKRKVMTEKEVKVEEKDTEETLQ
jgi:hypothetical protein